MVHDHLLRGGSGGSAVDGGVGGDHSPHYRSARGANRDANKGTNSFRKSYPAFRTGASGSANARPDESAGYKADHGMLAAPGARGGRDADNVFAFYRDVRAVFLQGKPLIGHADKFSAVALTNSPPWRFMLDSITSIP